MTAKAIKGLKIQILSPYSTFLGECKKTLIGSPIKNNENNEITIHHAVKIIDFILSETEGFLNEFLSSLKLIV